MSSPYDYWSPSFFSKSHHLNHLPYEPGPPARRLSFCTLIDILGFSEMTKLAHEQKASRHLLGRLNKALRDSKDALDKHKIDEEYWTHKFFTDNLLIGHLAEPYPAVNVEAMMAEAIHLAATHQLAMALNGFAVRGAMTAGDLFIGQDLVFGEALVRAHEIETSPSVSRSPRITLSIECIPVLWEDKGFSNAVFRDGDGCIFINYLNYQHYEFYDESLGSDVLPRHKRFVERGLNDFKGQKSTYKKYLWLAAYHNFFCQNVPYTEEQAFLMDFDNLIIEDVPEVGIQRISDREFEENGVEQYLDRQKTKAVKNKT